MQDDEAKTINKGHVPILRHLTPDKGKERKRKKVFKKTVKKRILYRRMSCSSKTSNVSQEYEQSLRKNYSVRKIPLISSGKKQIQWIESNADTTSSDENLFVQKNTKRARRRRSVINTTLNIDKSGFTEGASTQWIEEPLESITSIHEENTPHKLSKSLSVGNNSITNSNKISNLSFDATHMDGTEKSNMRKTNSIYEPTRSILVYTPSHIEPSLPLSDRVRITVKDLDLSRITKQHHLSEFQKFNYLIHPNSTVRFYPSDSEDDIPKPALSAKVLQMIAEDSESFDDDDPILIYNPRNLHRLNLREVPYNCD